MTAVKLKHRRTLSATSTPSRPKSASLLSIAALPRERHVGAWGLALLTFFNVSGGPWGSEPIVSACGPLPGFVMLAAMALFWGLPISLVTSELSSALPNNGGYVLWVDTAFGGFWGFQESFWSWGSCVVDNALYPVLAYETFEAMFKGTITEPLSASSSHHESNWLRAYLCKLVLTVLFSLPVLIGKTEWVTKGMAIMVVLLIMPFCILLPYVLLTQPLDPSQLLVSKPQPDLVYLLHVAFWNFNGFDCASTCAGEVHNPGRSYPLGLLSALLVVTLVTALPLLVATMANTPPWPLWHVGWWSAIANHEAGAWMAWWVVLSSVIGTFGMHAAVMWEDAWQLCGMAEQGLAPKWLAGRNKDLGTPENATIVSMLVVMGLIVFDFKSMVIIDNFFSVASGLLELAAFYELRMSRQDLSRPFQVPWIGYSRLGVGAFLLPPFGLGVLVLLTSFDNGWRSVFMLVPFLVVGAIIPTFYGRRVELLEQPALLPPSSQPAHYGSTVVDLVRHATPGLASVVRLTRSSYNSTSNTELDVLDDSRRNLGSIFTPADELKEHMREEAAAELLEEEEDEDTNDAEQGAMLNDTLD